MKTYLDCWIQVAAALLPQAVAGEPELIESLPLPLGEGAWAFAATLAGDEQGQFSVALDAAVRETPLLGEGADQKAAWGQLLREIMDAAAAELLAATGRRCRVETFEEFLPQRPGGRGFALRSGERLWAIRVWDGLRAAPPATGLPAGEPSARDAGAGVAPPAWSGLDLLLDVELEASLRFGSRELPLGEILDLGPGDVVQLDRHVSDPVDLIVADKIVARGEVVLVNGSFGLRVTEVATPRKRLESIRCLF